MNIDLNQLQEEALKKEVEELEQQEQDQQPEQVNEPETKKERTRIDLSKAIALGCITMSATALGVNLKGKADCAPVETPMLTSLQQENEQLKEENKVLQASRKRRNKDLSHIQGKALTEEQISELIKKAEEADTLRNQLKEEQQYSANLKAWIDEIKQRRKTNKENAQSRFDYKEWLRLMMEDYSELFKGGHV